MEWLVVLLILCIVGSYEYRFRSLREDFEKETSRERDVRNKEIMKDRDVRKRHDKLLRMRIQKIYEILKRIDY